MRDFVDRLGIEVNPEFDELIVAAGDGPTLREIDDELSLSVIAPSAANVLALQGDLAEWEFHHA